ncbi:hypothetical protein [Facilibium subflavum]|uniref:hypothetical protein n=1 Tax=Facilibium subflavum TaxID=2219058 RepID=UPI001F21C985|nr:hypothetical protein [Facilibium subflavum]
MIVTFISQCEKKAIKRTARVLDSFANRIGKRAWQTPITQEGLHAVKKLLRKTASKNTAVSCHRIVSRSRTELVWVVGHKQAFNHQGVVPVNYTSKELIMGAPSKAKAIKLDNPAQKKASHQSGTELHIMQGNEHYEAVVRAVYQPQRE